MWVIRIVLGTDHGPFTAQIHLGLRYIAAQPERNESRCRSHTAMDHFISPSRFVMASRQLI
jgi:hypothetical protein